MLLFNQEKVMKVFLADGSYNNTFSFLLNSVFDATNKPNSKRINLIKFQTKLVSFCTLHNNPPLSSRVTFFFVIIKTLIYFLISLLGLITSIKTETKYTKNIVQCWFYETSIKVLRLISKIPLPTLLLIWRQDSTAGSLKPTL